MSGREDKGYFDLDNFDDDKIEVYRRSHPQGRTTQRRTSGPAPQRRQPSGARRPSPGAANSRQRTRRRNSRRTRNRIVILAAGAAIIVLIIVLLSVMIRGCSAGSEDSGADVSTETKASGESVYTEAISGLEKALQPNYFESVTVEDDGADGENIYGIYIKDGSGFELFTADDSAAKNYAQTVSTAAEKLPSGTTVYDMVVPNSAEFGLPERIKSSEGSDSQAEIIETVYSDLSGGVVPVNPYNYLVQHSSEYIFFDSDHHWTGLGAYYAYTAFAGVAGKDALSLESCTEMTIDGFSGSFSAYSSELSSDTVHYWELPYDTTLSVKGTEDSSDYTSVYVDSSEESETLTVFAGGDNSETGITVLGSSSDKASGKIALVKDGLGCEIAPYLTYNYQEVHVIDYRYFSLKLADYCTENGITEVLFVNSVTSANSQMHTDSIAAILE